MKKIIVLFATLVILLALCSCHQHAWSDADCTTPSTCLGCGEIEGSALGHNWKDATCASPQTCSRCNLSEGEADGMHKWKEATCSSPQTCSVCGETEGSTVDHSWKSATCTKPKTCSVCGKTEGSTASHSWKSATCTTPKTCSVCGKTEGSTASHSWKSATCTTPKTCTVCGETSGSSGYHDWKSATCSAPKTCSVCGATEGTAKEHNYGYSNHKCYDCGQVDPEVTATLAKCSLTLPSLPSTINYYGYSGKRESSVKVTKIEPVFEYYQDGKVTLTAKFSGTKTYDVKGSGQSSACKIGWKLYDPSGNVLRTGTFSSPQIAMGESFANQEDDLIYNFEAAAPGTYKLVILDVN